MSTGTCAAAIAGACLVSAPALAAPRGARVHARIDGADSAELRGRQQQHWSYFLNDGGSPLEGNVWTGAGAGQYVADTPLGPGRFSDLDLYAMGVLPPSAVGTQQLLRPAAPSAATDCLALPLNAMSPPQSCGPYQTQATLGTFGIDDVIAVEGERAPPAGAVPLTVDIAVVVLESGAKPFDLAGCQALTRAVQERIADFATATGGRLLLNNLVSAGADCATFAEDSSEPMPSGGCAVAPGVAAPSGGTGWPGLVGALLGLAVWCLRRRRVSPSS